VAGVCVVRGRAEEPLVAAGVADAGDVDVLALVAVPPPACVVLLAVFEVPCCLCCNFSARSAALA